MGRHIRDHMKTIFEVASTLGWNGVAHEAQATPTVVVAGRAIPGPVIEAVAFVDIVHEAHEVGFEFIKSTGPYFKTRTFPPTAADKGLARFH